MVGSQWHSSSADLTVKMFGPVYRNQLLGACCPCLESDESHFFRVAQITLESVNIRWKRMVRPRPVSLSRSHTRNGCLLDGACCQVKSGYTHQKERRIKAPPNYISIDAQLSVVDTSQGPALRIISTEFVFADDDAEDTLLKRSGKTGDITTAKGVVGSISDNIRMTKTIPLQEIGQVVAANDDDWGPMGWEMDEESSVWSLTMEAGIILKAKGESTSETKTLAIFEVVDEVVSRDMVMHHLYSLIRWECQRLDIPQGDTLKTKAKKQMQVVSSKKKDIRSQCQNVGSKLGIPTDNADECSVHSAGTGSVTQSITSVDLEDLLDPDIVSLSSRQKRRNRKAKRVVSPRLPERKYIFCDIEK